MSPEAMLFAREFDRAGRRVGVRRRGGLVGSDIFVVAERYRVPAHELVHNIERRGAIAALKGQRSRRTRGRRAGWLPVIVDLIASSGVTDEAMPYMDDVPLAAEALGMSVVEMLDVVDARVSQGLVPQLKIAAPALT